MEKQQQTVKQPTSFSYHPSRPDFARKMLGTQRNCKYNKCLVRNPAFLGTSTNDTLFTRRFFLR